jgi:hypothetical protein
MAVHKAIRTNPPAQPRPQQAGPKAERPTSNRHQFKAEIFDVLRNLNRGYGVALAALDKLETKARRIFPTDFLHGYRSRAEALRAETNRDLLHILAGHEEQDAVRFATFLTAKDAKDAKS